MWKQKSSIGKNDWSLDNEPDWLVEMRERQEERKRKDGLIREVIDGKRKITDIAEVAKKLEEVEMMKEDVSVSEVVTELGLENIEKRQMLGLLSIEGVEPYAFEGRSGMRIADDNGDVYAMAKDILAYWGVKSGDIGNGVNALNFLMNLRNRFLERYESMLSCVASVRDYAEFKGVSYAAMMSKVVSRKERIDNLMAKSNIGGFYLTESQRKWLNEFDVIVIGGTKFVLVGIDDFYAWHKFLANKGMVYVLDREEYDKALYLKNVYEKLGGKAEELAGITDSVTSFLGQFCGGIVAKGEDDRQPKGKGYFYDMYRGGIGMNELYKMYRRYAVDTKKVDSVSYVVFCRRVYSLGFVKYVKKGERGIYFYRKDGEPVTGVDMGGVKLRKRGRY